MRTPLACVQCVSLGVYKIGLVIVVTVNSCYNNGDFKDLADFNWVKLSGGKWPARSLC